VNNDPSEQQQAEKQDKDSEKNGDDESSASASLGLINTAPVQLKNELEEPVTSGGMDTMIDNPGVPD
jgi:hypothetical protein